MCSIMNTHSKQKYYKQKWQKKMENCKRLQNGETWILSTITIEIHTIIDFMMKESRKIGTGNIIETYGRIRAKYDQLEIQQIQNIRNSWNESQI